MKIFTLEMPVPSTEGRYAYFDCDHDIGVVGYGSTLEQAFEGAAEATFGLVADLSHVHAERTLPVSFIEADDARALMRWLHLLIEAARQHQLVFSEFHLQREHGRWWGCATGQSLPGGLGRDVQVKRAARDRTTVKRTARGWEASCVVQCSPHTSAVARSPAFPVAVG